MEGRANAAHWSDQSALAVPPSTAPNGRKAAAAELLTAYVVIVQLLGVLSSASAAPPGQTGRPRGKRKK